jgi:predicted NBD/HSP70 family sugar kinase
MPRAAAAPEGPRLRPRGSNQIGLRQFNERVVLQAIRLHGALAQAELARLTHLTAQTVSLIIARLEGDGLLLRLAPVRGRVGQPSVPIALNPDGAFSIGLMVGRRRLDALIVDFAGRVRERLSVAYRYPNPDTLFDQIDAALKALRGSLAPALRDRVLGVGVAAPLGLEGWQQLLDIEPELASKWRQIDLRERIAALTDLPVDTVKDTAAACVAELVAGRGRSIRSFLYIFVDTFVGGGLVLDSHLRSGVRGNAGAIGSLPMQIGVGGASADAPFPPQMLGLASLWNLESAFSAAGLDPAAFADERAMQDPWRPHTRAWLHTACPALAMCISSAACLLDLEGVIIDGSTHRDTLDMLVQEVKAALALYNWEGVTPPDVLTGTIGTDARALGGALLPMYSNFAPDSELFLKIAP